MHYPPVTAKSQNSGFIDIMKECAKVEMNRLKKLKALKKNCLLCLIVMKCIPDTVTALASVLRKKTIHTYDYDQEN